MSTNNDGSNESSDIAEKNKSHCCWSNIGNYWLPGNILGTVTLGEIWNEKMQKT
jgi:hypothetical protein